MEALLKNTFTQISPSYELVQDVTVSGSAVTNLDITSLNISKLDDYLIGVYIVGTGGDYKIYFNGNYTDSNYYRTYMSANGTTLGSGSNNAPFFLYSTSNSSFALCTLKLTNNGNIGLYVHDSINVGTSSFTNTSYEVSSTFTTTSITSIRINSVTANQIGIGSRVQLYKRVVSYEYDTTISGSAVSYVDFTGLTQDKTGEYLLISNIVNNGGPTYIYLTANGNTTVTNYWVQRITASGLGAERVNAPGISVTASGGKTLLFTKIKLTNNGLIEYQTDSMVNYGGSTHYMLESITTSTFTASSITSLRISNGIGVGSRFQLIKLK